MQLSEEQEACCDWFRGPLLCLGTPGAGKTTVIVNRVMRLTEKYHIPEKEILVITFTRAAAKEMETRYIRMSGKKQTGVRFSTFHSFFYWILRTAYPKGKELKVLPQNEAKLMMMQILKEILMEEGDQGELADSVLRQLDRISADGIALENYYSTDIGETEFRQAAWRFAEEKGRRGTVDFNDMSGEALRLLREVPEIRSRLQELYPFILVDEYQDTNRVQYQALKLLLGEEKNLFAVGDDDQSVYGFRGGRPEIMLSFKKDFPDGKIMALSRNFRCPGKVTLLSDGLIRHNRKRYPKSLVAASGTKGTVRCIHVRDRRQETDQLIKEILRAVEGGVPYREIAVLTRTNKGAEGLIFQLDAYDIPFYLKERPVTFFSGIAVRPVIAFLRWLSGDHSRKNFMLFMNRPVRYIPRKVLTDEIVNLRALYWTVQDTPYLAENVEELIRDLEAARPLTPNAAVTYFRTVMGYDEYLQTLARDRNLYYDEMSDRLEDLLAFTADTPDYPSFFDKMSRMEQLMREHGEENRDAVQLMTMHGAKGLEFDEVHIPDLYEGSIPYRRAKSPDEVEEERRLLYVGMTRTKKTLHLYVPDYVRDKPSEPSRFLRELEETANGSKIS